jgi:D-alanine--D-alanine ligase
MRIGVVRTVGSPCRCAESVSIGLQSLNHEPYLVDSREIEIHAQELAAHCDLVIDHTDTYCGRGLYRPFVRLLLENAGARVVGSSAQACFTADNKAAAKALLAEAGIPVPPGIVIHSNAWELPDWLRPPLVLKPAFEHMSRGIRLAQTEQEAYDAAAEILASLRQPVLVESYIPGRELAVSLLADSNGVQMLPVLEWKIPGDETAVLTENFKLMDPADERHKTLRAGLDHNLEAELEELAQHAFHALNLRDYARFDVRLSPGGTIYFLEANTTPSLEPLEALAASAAWAGLDYTPLVDRLLSNAQSRYESSSLRKKSLLRIPLFSGTVELEIASGVYSPPQSSIDLAHLLDIRPGERVLDLGCGSGLLSIAAAMQGAGRVVATDLNPEALQTTKENARRNGVADRIEIRAGSWHEALRTDQHEQFDVIIATPPQTPGSKPFGPKYGGPDGTRHLRNIVRGAPAFLKPDGRLWIMAISLANPNDLWKNLSEHFAEASLIHKTDRPFTAAEYDSMQPGLFEYLISLRSAGLSDFVETGKGQCYFHNLFIRAANRRRT